MCIFTCLRFVKIPRPLMKNSRYCTLRNVIYFLIYELRSQDITRSQCDVGRGAAASRTTAASLCSTAASSDAVWPIPLHCGRFRYTVAASCCTTAASTRLRPLSALLRPLSALLRPPSPHYCGRSMSESDCVRSMFRSGRIFFVDEV